MTIKTGRRGNRGDAAQVKKIVDDIDRTMRAMSTITESVLHDVRNQLLPLAGYVDLMLSNESEVAGSRSNLTDVQEACRSFDSTLKRLSALARGVVLPTETSVVSFEFERAMRIMRSHFGRELAVTHESNGSTLVPELMPGTLSRALAILSACALWGHVLRPSVALSAVDAESGDAVTIKLTVRGRGDVDEERDRAMVASLLALTLPEVPLATDIVSTAAGCECSFTVSAKPAKAAPPITAGESPRARRSERVLVTGVEAISRDLTRSYLMAKGYQVSAAASLADALASLAGSSPPQAVVVDVNNHASDAMTTFVESCRAHGVGLVIVSCAADRADSYRSLPGVTVLVRPFRMPELSRVLRSGFDHRPAPTRTG